MRTLKLLLICSLWFMPQYVHADPSDAQQAEDDARQKYINRFLKFTQDKNVMGKAATPDGKAVGGGRKVRFDNDDGVAYESDLTYHDFVYNTNEKDPNAGGGGQRGQGQGNNQQQQQRRLYAFVSPHGKLTSAGGSSLLERTVYQLHNKYVQQEQKKQQQGTQDPDDDKTGVKFKSVYKIETRQVVAQGGQGQGQGQGQGGQQGQAKPQKVRVERLSLRDDVKKAVEDVGTNSFQSIKRAAQDDDRKGDPKALPNLTMLYEAAGRAVKAMWDTTLSKVVQRRVERAVPDDGMIGKPQLSEETPTCDIWAARAAQAALQNATGSQRQVIEKELQQINQECKQLAALPYNAINPVEQDNSRNPGQVQIKLQGPQYEDPVERDERNQLELMAKAGKSVDSLKTNWKYTQADAENTFTKFDSGGNAVGTVQMTPKDQLEAYNKNLQASVQGFDEVKARFPDLNYSSGAIMANQIKPETTSIMAIDKPTASQMEELGVSGTENTSQPTTYGQLNQYAAKENQKAR